MSSGIDRELECSLCGREKLEGRNDPRYASFNSRMIWAAKHGKLHLRDKNSQTPSRIGTATLKNQSSGGMFKSR